MKRCGKCLELKPLSGFFRKSKSPDGLQHRCKECQQKSLKDRSRTEKYRASLSAWRSRNPSYGKSQAMTVARRKWARLYPEKARKWQRDNPEAFKAAQKKRAKEDMEQLTDVYVRKALAHTSPLKPSEFPQWLVDLKREHIRLIRELRTRKEMEDENCAIAT